MALGASGYISVKGEPLISFAGLYTESRDADGVPLRTFTINHDRTETACRGHVRLKLRFPNGLEPAVALAYTST